MFAEGLHYLSCFMAMLFVKEFFEAIPCTFGLFWLLRLGLFRFFGLWYIFWSYFDLFFYRVFGALPFKIPICITGLRAGAGARTGAGTGTVIRIRSIILVGPISGLILLLVTVIVVPSSTPRGCR